MVRRYTEKFMLDRLNEVLNAVCGCFIGQPFSDEVVYRVQVMIDKMLVELQKEKYIDFEYQMNVSRWKSEDGFVIRALFLKILDDYGINIRVVFDPRENEIKVERV